MTRRKTEPFAERLEVLAHSIVTDLISAGSGMSLQQRIDGFKALTSYWVAAEKVAAKLPPEEDDNLTSFSKWRDKIAGGNNA